TFTADDNGAFTGGSVTLKTAGSQTVTATDSVTASINGTSNAVTVNPAAPATAAFVQEPTNTTAGVSISPAVTVHVQDAFANNVPSSNVTITILNNAGGGTLSGTTTQSTNGSGVATFSDLSINKSGTGYTLRATTVNAIT